MKNIIQSEFMHLFHKNPDHIIFAPGRANIIGEHTDYNQGFVLPFAIQLGIWFAFSNNGTDTHHIYAFNQKEWLTFDPDMDVRNVNGWKKFITQACQIVNMDKPGGLHMVFGGNLPSGAGISSSSALTCGWITALLMNEEETPDVKKIVDYTVAAERGYGVQGGMMDQFTIVNGQKNTAILLDCFDLTAQYLPLQSQLPCFYLFNTHVRHHLVDTEYNKRPQECEEAVRILQQSHSHIQSLRDATIQDLDVLLPHPVLYERALFVVSENKRVLDSSSAILTHDWTSLGQLMYESHEGLRTQYEVSCNELDHLVRLSTRIPQILGSRMMGGGFGGCTINLTIEPLTDSIQQQVKNDYKNSFGYEPDIIPISSENGIAYSL